MPFFLTIKTDHIYDWESCQRQNNNYTWLIWNVYIYSISRTIEKIINDVWNFHSNKMRRRRRKKTAKKIISYHLSCSTAGVFLFWLKKWVMMIMSNRGNDKKTFRLKQTFAKCLLSYNRRIWELALTHVILF
jgi:hypothetical protein